MLEMNVLDKDFQPHILEERMIKAVPGFTLCRVHFDELFTMAGGEDDFYYDPHDVKFSREAKFTCDAFPCITYVFIRPDGATSLLHCGPIAVKKRR